MEFKSPMKEKYGDAESIHIPISSSDGLQFLNGTVHSLCPTIAFAKFEGIEYASLMAVKHFYHLVYLWDMCSFSPLSPHEVENEHLCMFALSLNDVTKLFLDAPCIGNRQIRLDDSIKPDLLSVCKIGLVFEEKILAPLENGISLDLTFPDTVNSLLEVTYKMVWVMADANLWHEFQSCIFEVVPHVNCECQYVSLLYRIQSFVYQSLGIFSLPAFLNLKYCAVIRIENTGIAMSTMGLLVYMYMVIHNGMATMGKSILHSAFHHVMYLILCKAK